MVTTDETTELPRRKKTGTLSSPWGRPFLFAWILLALSLGTGAAAYRTFNRFETGIGTLQAKSRGVYARREARISAILVRQGEVVEPGTPLLTLQDVQLERQVKDLAHQVSVQKALLEERTARGEVELHNRKQALEREVFRVEMQKADYQRPMTMDEAQQTAQYETGVRPISDADQPSVNPSTAPTQKYLAQIRLCDERLAKLGKELETLPEEIRTACGVKTAEAKLKQLEAELADVEAEQKTLTLVAEVHGTVGVLQAQVGDLVAAKQQIVSLMDEDQPYLVVKIPSNKLTEYAPGTELRILFPGKVEMSGRVEVIPPQADNQEGTRPSEVALVVTPIGAEWPKVPFGATVEVQRDR